MKKSKSNKEFAELGLASRYHRRLERVGVTTVADLCLKTEEELCQIRWIGRDTIGAIKDALASRGLTLTGGSQNGKPTCICNGKPEMGLFALRWSGSEIWECGTCARLLYRSKATADQTWYKPEAEMGKRLCQDCQTTTMHIKKGDGLWLCLECQIREHKRGSEKEAE